MATDGPVTPEGATTTKMATNEAIGGKIGDAKQGAERYFSGVPSTYTESLQRAVADQQRLEDQADANNVRRAIQDQKDLSASEKPTGGIGGTNLERSIEDQAALGSKEYTLESPPPDFRTASAEAFEAWASVPGRDLSKVDQRIRDLAGAFIEGAVKASGQFGPKIAWDPAERQQFVQRLAAAGAITTPETPSDPTLPDTSMPWNPDQRQNILDKLTKVKQAAGRYFGQRSTDTSGSIYGVSKETLASNQPPTSETPPPPPTTPTEGK